MISALLVVVVAFGLFLDTRPSPAAYPTPSLPPPWQPFGQAIPMKGILLIEYMANFLKPNPPTSCEIGGFG
jgi:hypothetical protein